MLDIFRIAWGRQFWGITENNINLSIHPSINSYKRHRTTLAILACNLQSGLFRVEHMLWIRMMQQPIFCQIRSFFAPKKTTEGRSVDAKVDAKRKVQNNPICFAPCPSIGLEKVGNWRNWQKCGFPCITMIHCQCRSLD